MHAEDGWSTHVRPRYSRRRRSAFGQAAPEGCCVSDTCRMLTPQDCQAIGGIPEGPGTTCDGTLNVCEQACCKDKRLPRIMFAGVCLAQGGKPEGPGSTCVVGVPCAPQACTGDAQCDDGDLCTTDHCDPTTGTCVHDPVNCDDGDVCHYRHVRSGRGLRSPAQSGLLSLLSAGWFLRTTPPIHMSAEGRQGPACRHDLHDDNLRTSPGGEVPPAADRGSGGHRFGSVGIAQRNPEDGRGCGRRFPLRRTTDLRGTMWGSYLIGEYMPQAYGGYDQVPYQIDGWMLSFHLPTTVKSTTSANPKRPALGLYFAPREAVQITLTNLTSCDGHKVFEYYVDLAKCCLIQSTRIRVCPPPSGPMPRATRFVQRTPLLLVCPGRPGRGRHQVAQRHGGALLRTDLHQQRGPGRLLGMAHDFDRERRPSGGPDDGLLRDPCRVPARR